MDLLLYCLGGALLAALVWWWRPEVSWRSGAAFLLLAGAFFAVPLATPDIQVPTDIAYRVRPWSETLPEKVKAANPLLADIPLFVLPMRTLARERLLRLEAPLWTHEIGTGQPLLGSAQAAPFAPLHLMALPLPPLRALTLTVAWQVLLALLLTYALVLALGGGRAGAAVAAVAFAFSSYEIAWAYHPLGMAAVFLPGVMLGLVLLRRGERGGLAGLVVCAWGMATAGHPETLAHTALACCGVTAALLVSRGGIPRGRFLARLAAAAGLAACLAAPVLLPVLEVLPESERAVVLERSGLMAVQPPPFEPRFLLLLADPLFLGSPRDGNWRGPGNFNELCSLYGGLLALGLALAGAVVLRGRVGWILAGGLATLLAALGVPPFFEAVIALPGLGAAAHGRLRLLWVLAVAVAAGLSLEKLLQERRRVAGVALALAGLALVLAPPPAGAPWQQAWWVATLAGVAAVLAVLALPRLRNQASWVAVGALILDLTVLGVRYHPVLPARFDLAAPPVLRPVIEEAARSREEGAPFRIVAEGWDLYPDLPVLYGLWDPRGNDPMRPAGAAHIVGRGYCAGFHLGQTVLLKPGRNPQALQDFLGVRYLLTRHRARMPPPWQPAWNDAGGQIWRNPQALPLFFFPASLWRSPDPGEVTWWTVANRDFLARMPVEARPGESSGLTKQEGRVRLLRVRANGFDLETDSRTGGVGASSVSYAPGWRVEVDGRPGTPRRVASGFLGFEVSPGRHRIRLDYRPTGWIWGWVLAGIGLAGCGVGALASRSSLLGGIGADLKALEGGGALSREAAPPPGNEFPGYGGSVG
ncbi:MAG TPA: YfhO family protein [Thermoanaerobaculia bacterium]|nr:YfhO family protein [Thermoanaerobaculia bacterium]